MRKGVRNFWIEANIDGRQAPLRGGPTDEDGGFKLRIRQKDGHRIITPVVITGKSDGNNLTLTITPGEYTHWPDQRDVDREFVITCKTRRIGSGQQ